MTMNARLKRFSRPEDISFTEEKPPSGEIKTYSWSNPRDGLLLQCVLIHPPSVEGRTVLLRLTEKDRDDLLLMLRSEAVRARQEATT